MSTTGFLTCHLDSRLVRLRARGLARLTRQRNQPGTVMASLSYLVSKSVNTVRASPTGHNQGHADPPHEEVESWAVAALLRDLLCPALQCETDNPGSEGIKPTARVLHDEG